MHSLLRAGPGERDVELSKHVARRQSHLLEICRIPRTQDDSAIVRLVLQFVDDVCQLVDTLTGIICLCVHIFGTEVSPLEAVDWSKVAFFTVAETDTVEVLATAIAVPDLDTLIRERL